MSTILRHASLPPTLRYSVLARGVSPLKRDGAGDDAL